MVLSHFFLAERHFLLGLMVLSGFKDLFLFLFIVRNDNECMDTMHLSGFLC